MIGVLHFMAVSTGPVLNYRTLSPPLGPVNFAARHRALPKNRHRDRRAPSGIVARIRSALSAVIRVEVFEREIDALIGTG
jgi:hypothetical protein